MMMSKIHKPSWLAMSAVLSAAFLASGSKAIAQEVNTSDPTAIGNYAEFNDPIYDDLETGNGLDDLTSDPLSQVTNVNQLRDVSPTDWAYEALRSLVDRYGCIAGFPNQTYRGEQPLSRYEFAAGLNSCLNQIERLIASSEAISREDLETVRRLSQEFEAELATIGGRLDNIEGRTAFLEDNTFSTTTKLQGEVVFNLADAFGDEAAAGIVESEDDEGDLDNPDLDVETTFSQRIRLQLVTSFTGKDKLFTRLTGGNIGNSFQDETLTREGRFAYDGASGNNISVDRLHYSFPLLNDNLQVTAMAGLAAHHFYAETFNSGLNVGGGANGALSRFGERNPIYRQGIAGSSAGLGATYSIGELIEISGGYIAPDGADPADERGLFSGSFSAMGQITVKPIEKLKLGATYVRGYDNLAGTDDDGNAAFRGSFLWGGTGTNQANLRGVEVDSPVATNTVGVQFQFDLTNRISIRGWGGYTDANIILPGDDNNGSATIFNYAGAVVISDLLKEGSMAAVIVGAEPYLTAIDADGVDGDETITNDVPLHIEAFYKYQLNDNISITPGLIWLTTPNQNEENDDIVIGALRTTFTF